MKGKLSNSLVVLACNMLCAMNVYAQTSPANDLVAEGEKPVRVSQRHIIPRRSNNIFQLIPMQYFPVARFILFENI